MYLEVVNLQKRPGKLVNSSERVGERELNKPKEARRGKVRKRERWRARCAAGCAGVVVTKVKSLER